MRVLLPLTARANEKAPQFFFGAMAPVTPSADVPDGADKDGEQRYVCCLCMRLGVCARRTW